MGEKNLTPKAHILGNPNIFAKKINYKDNLASIQAPISYFLKYIIF